MDTSAPTAPTAPNTAPARAKVRAAHRADEADVLVALAQEASLSPGARDAALQDAAALVRHVRAQRRKVGGVDALMQEYDLSSAEGVTLMCLAEALLRIPDTETIDDFIEDKLGGADWSSHLGLSDSFFVNASTYGLMMAGRTVRIDEARGPALGRLTRRLGEPVIRNAVRQAMRIMGRQFVMGRTIEAASRRAAPLEAKGNRFSYDMLGEAARTMADADRYMRAYEDAIDAVGKAAAGRGPIESPGVSVKLSALHPRYEFAQADRVSSELKDRLISLCARAAKLDVGLCVDAEEADRLDLSLDLISAAGRAPETRGWEGFGLAVQAYQKRARPLIDWLAEEARASKRRLLTRLVKGAYWDTEIKRAQEAGVVDYPVFTRKTNTDVSYMACARALLSAPDAFYPCFATHNAVTLASVRALAGGARDYEFQRLHGMGEALYEPIIAGDDAHPPVACRIYAPVGGHEELLAYLVRRLLENGANSSFVNRIADDALPLEDIVIEHVDRARRLGLDRHPQIPKPGDLFAPGRANSAGIDLSDPDAVAALDRAMAAGDVPSKAAPMISGAAPTDAGPPGPAQVPTQTLTNPADPGVVIGTVRHASADEARAALDAAAAAYPTWSATPASERAAVLDRAADRFEADTPLLMRLIVTEGGRTLPDALSEVREAIDFLRYYANQARAHLSAPAVMPGPTGETNAVSLYGRGPFLCISPWNFPLAIFTGQVAAALVAGNPVLAKPAEQTPLTAQAAIARLHAAGAPLEALQFLPGDGPTIGAALLSDPRLAGVAFTGSTETARLINQALAARDGPIATLIAETGGVNAMIVDSTALPEQVTRDVVASAFQSAGQRCSALRLLCLQEEIAERQIAMIIGAMRELRLGDPRALSTDVGPVIDDASAAQLRAYCAAQAADGRVLAQAPPPHGQDAEHDQHARFVRPTLVRLDAPGDLTQEIFGPVLHVATYTASGLDQLVDTLNATGYGLTLGVHSRSDARVARVTSRARIGNIYVNRNQIGAVVGVQPFGGEGLSGTGPKAGGPHYLTRFTTERTVTVDTTASGGNASLMAMDI